MHRSTSAPHPHDSLARCVHPRAQHPPPRLAAPPIPPTSPPGTDWQIARMPLHRTHCSLTAAVRTLGSHDDEVVSVPMQNNKCTCDGAALALMLPSQHGRSMSAMVGFPGSFIFHNYGITWFDHFCNMKACPTGAPHEPNQQGIRRRRHCTQHTGGECSHPTSFSCVNAFVYM